MYNHYKFRRVHLEKCNIEWIIFGFAGFVWNTVNANGI